MIKKYRKEAMLLILGIALTVIAREHAVNYRAALNLKPSWGGEFAILPLIIVAYAALKADWSVE